MTMDFELDRFWCVEEGASNIVTDHIMERSLDPPKELRRKRGKLV